jgi:uncharacterized membrane protein
VSVNVSTDILINRPVPAVAAYAADPDNTPAWYINIKSVEWKTPRPLRVGSLVAFRAQFLGRALAYTYEVVEWIPDRRFAMKTADGPFPMETTYTWSAEGDATRMTLSNRGEPKGFSAWVAPFMSVAMRRANRKDLALLKRVLEQKQ